MAGFRYSTSLRRIQIPGFVEIISTTAFCAPSSLHDIHFSTPGKLREIAGFRYCKSLCRIDIPASVQIIFIHAFNGCSSLNEIHFSTPGDLREIAGFGN
jgi:hypothetical protein